MKIFQIIDEENALLAGILLYYEKAKTCIIELPEYLDEWTAPLLSSVYSFTSISNFEKMSFRPLHWGRCRRGFRSLTYKI